MFGSDDLLRKIGWSSQTSQTSLSSDFNGINPMNWIPSNASSFIIACETTTHDMFGLISFNHNLHTKRSPYDVVFGYNKAFLELSLRLYVVMKCKKSQHPVDKPSIFPCASKSFTCCIHPSCLLLLTERKKPGEMLLGGASRMWIVVA